MIIKSILLFFILFIITDKAYGQVEGLYCGKENCYDVLGVTRDDEKSTIMRSYRKLARVLHPDRQRTVESKAEAEVKFRKVATAYEILRDDEQRKEYDYMLDNPDEMYYHYYQYFRRRYGPKVDVRIVICVIISLVSIAQYYSQCVNYNDAISYLTREPKYRNRAKEIAKSEGLLADNQNRKRENGRRRTKEEIKAEEESLIKKIIIEKMDINAVYAKKGGYAKPSFGRILWVQMFKWPWWLVQWICGWCRWFILYWILKREYSEEDKMAIIKRYMNLPDLHWERIEDHEKQYYMDRELWKKPNFEVYKEEKEAEMKEKLASDPSYKRYRRFMKKGGAGQITFGQEDVDMDYN